uniref:Uncharacterized protein n=1 Tax=Arundo donax TaxID=35708 RepID=A0A0A9HS77_ARUDO
MAMLMARTRRAGSAGSCSRRGGRCSGTCGVMRSAGGIATRRKTWTWKESSALRRRRQRRWRW